ncbi:MAG: NAD(P)H-dependent oxidoreductase [Spirochaetales bacterium]|nr:NAD(P)H-dependent oxidoreductase [Spirochaetales bacterium]
MKVLVLNGSPKGSLSFSLQCFDFLKTQFPGNHYEVIHVGQRINAIEKRQKTFTSLIEKLKEAELIIWLSPVYYFAVPAQLKRFVEIIYERKIEYLFKGKYACVLTTSLHFADYLVQNYINAICDDLGMNFLEGFSTSLADMQKPGGKNELKLFFKFLLDNISRGIAYNRKYPPLHFNSNSYTPEESHQHLPEIKNIKMTLLTDMDNQSGNLQQMINVFTGIVPGQIKLVNLNVINIKAGCFHCLHCTVDGICVHEDDVARVFHQYLLPADIIIFAAAIRERYLSARWKMFIDRLLFNGLSPAFPGKQTGFLIAGPLQQLPDLRYMLETYVQTQGMNNIGFISDEYEQPEDLTKAIYHFTQSLLWAVENNYRKPMTFHGVGGHKIFRDFFYEYPHLYWKDHMYYKKNNLYDFPQKRKIRSIKNKLNSFFCRFTRFRSRILKRARISYFQSIKKLF